MSSKVVDFFVYQLEKKIKDNGFLIKKDNNKNIKVLCKLCTDEKVGNS